MPSEVVAMIRRLTAVPVLTALALLVPSAHAAAPAPQLIDPTGDANFTSAATPDKVTPAGSQDYADVVSVLWQTTKTTKIVKKKKVTTVTGFTVTATLAAAPKPPQGTSLVYRMLGATGKCPFFGVAYYTAVHSDKNIPQSAIRDVCGRSDTDAARLTSIALPAIVDKTITWNVPLSAIPKDAKIGPGTKLTGLWFQVAEIEDFQGHCLPSEDTVPAEYRTGYGGACGLGAGTADTSPKDSTASFTIG
jgi:hypothetical protein